MFEYPEPIYIPTTVPEGYTWGGTLWRNLVTQLSGGTVDAMGISQHNREIKASGGSTTSALLDALGSAFVSGQDRFMQTTGKTGSFADSIKAGIIAEYAKKFLPWIILILFVVVFGIYKIAKRK